MPNIMCSAQQSIMMVQLISYRLLLLHECCNLQMALVDRHVDKPNVKRVISVPYTMEDFLRKLDDQDKWEIIHHVKKAHQ